MLSFNDELEYNKTASQMAERAVALFIIATYSNGLIQKNCPLEESKQYINKFIKKYSAESAFTKKELDFINSECPSDEESGFLCWRWESLNFLLWIMSYNQELGDPNQPCLCFQCSKVFNKHKSIESISKTKLRDSREVSMKARTILDLDEKSPNVDIGILSEWKRIIQWVFTDQEWDQL